MQTSRDISPIAIAVELYITAALHSKKGEDGVIISTLSEINSKSTNTDPNMSDSSGLVANMGPEKAFKVLRLQLGLEMQSKHRELYDEIRKLELSPDELETAIRAAAATLPALRIQPLERTDN